MRTTTAPAVVLYGIPNCDTVKKARAWLAERGVAVTFHDVKKQGMPDEALGAWVTALGWEAMVNRSGTTWRKLDEATRAAVVDAASARTLLQGQPSALKRPVVQWPDGALTVGFSPERFQQHLG